MSKEIKEIKLLKMHVITLFLPLQLKEMYEI